MAEVINGIGTKFLEIYESFISLLPSTAQDLIGLFLLVILVVIYAVFVWKFYRFIATKNILKLNLNKYNKSEHPVFAKIIATGFYLLEYIIILPFLIFFWFTVFTIFLIFLTESLDVGTVLIVSATIIAAIRMTSYYSEDLSKELAKLLPFMLLAISILQPNFFDIERIFSHFSAIPSFFGQITYYLLFIICLEIILRLFDFVFSIFNVHEEPEKVEEAKAKKEKTE